MKVIVSGSRDYTDKNIIKYWLDYFNPTYIVDGGQRGADTIAWQYAVDNNLGWIRIAADWDKYGKKAGPIRNQQMLDETKPDLVLAFPLEGSIGTYDMIRKAVKAKVRTISIHKDGKGYSEHYTNG